MRLFRPLAVLTQVRPAACPRCTLQFTQLHCSCQLPCFACPLTVQAADPDRSRRSQVLGGAYIAWRALRTLHPGAWYAYSIPFFLAEFMSYCLSFCFFTRQAMGQAGSCIACMECLHRHTVAGPIAPGQQGNIPATRTGVLPAPTATQCSLWSMIERPGRSVHEMLAAEEVCMLRVPWVLHLQARACGLPCVPIVCHPAAQHAHNKRTQMRILQVPHVDVYICTYSGERGRVCRTRRRAHADWPTAEGRCGSSTMPDPLPAPLLLLCCRAARDRERRGAQRAADDGATAGLPGGMQHNGVPCLCCLLHCGLAQSCVSAAPCIAGGAHGHCSAEPELAGQQADGVHPG